jgi:hypothetical protein
MNARYILLAVMLATEALAVDSVIAPRVTVPGRPIYIQRTNYAYILNTNAASSLIARPGHFRPLLVQFAVSAPSGSPTNYVISGKVVDNNAGAPIERAEILFDSPTYPLRLAALTNADGEFKFRVLLREGVFNDTRLWTRSLDESMIYVSSQFGGYPDRNTRELDIGLGSATAFAYSIQELLAPVPVTRPAQKQ